MYDAAYKQISFDYCVNYNLPEHKVAIDYDTRRNLNWVR